MYAVIIQIVHVDAPGITADRAFVMCYIYACDVPFPCLEFAYRVLWFLRSLLSKYDRNKLESLCYKRVCS